MRILTFTHPNNLTRLQDELSRVPGLQPVDIPGGLKMAIFSLEASGQDITVHVPDNTDEQAIAAVVNAHDPTPDPVPPPPDFGADVPADFAYQVAQLVARMRTSLGTPAASMTEQLQIAAIKDLQRGMLYLFKRQIG